MGRRALRPSWVHRPRVRLVLAHLLRQGERHQEFRPQLAAGNWPAVGRRAARRGAHRRTGLSDDDRSRRCQQAGSMKGNIATERRRACRQLQTPPCDGGESQGVGRESRPFSMRIDGSARRLSRHPAGLRPAAMCGKRLQHTSQHRAQALWLRQRRLVRHPAGLRPAAMCGKRLQHTSQHRAQALWLR
jgi:hypothetical protein